MKNISKLDLFSILLDKKVTLNYTGCKRIGTVKKIKYINGIMHINILFPDMHTLDNGKEIPYFWEGYYESNYVKFI